MASEAEALLAWQLDMAGITGYVREYRFHPERKWRFDVAFPDPEHKLAVEVDGGVHARGRHVRGAGYIEDCHKFAEATILGWRILRCPSGWVESGEALQYIERALKEQKEGANNETPTT